MANIWIPARSKLATALREPALLSPERKPTGKLKLRSKWVDRVKRLFLCDSLRERVDDVIVTVAGTTYIKPGPYGMAWSTDGSASSYFDSNSTKTYASDQHCDVVSFSDTSGLQGYISSTVNDGSSFIDDIAINTNRFEGQQAGYLFKILRGTSANILSAESNVGINDGELHNIAFAQIGTFTLELSVDGSPKSVTYGTRQVASYPATSQYNYWYGTRNVRGVGSSGLDSDSHIYLIARIEGYTTETERNALSANPFAELFEPANQTPYLVSVPAAGGFTMVADTGGFTLTGVDASLAAGRRLSSQPGAYALTGIDAATKAGRLLTSSAGAYALNGIDASLNAGRHLSSSPGAYALTGVDTSFSAGRRLPASAGAYALTGVDATLTYTPIGAYQITADTGAYTLTGSDAALTVSRKMAAASAAFTLTGTDAGLYADRKMSAGIGAYTLAGIAASLNYSGAGQFSILADPGTFVLTGTAASFDYSAIPTLGRIAHLVAADRMAHRVAADRMAHLID